MIDSIGAIADTPIADQVPGGDLGRDEFMKLLVAQLQNQDPLSPLGADDLAVQLAQFSSVEQLLQINENIQAIGVADGILAESVAASTAVGLIGKNVRAAVDQVTLDGSGSASIDVIAPPGGGSGTVRIFDGQGAEVASYDAGPLVPGSQTIDLTTLDKGVSPGTYRISVEVSDASGNAVPVPTMISGFVNGVRYDRAGPVLMVGVTEFPLSAVLEVTN